TLEYKAADALGKSDGKKKEMTKDVSAMANSADGTVFYGIAEYQDPSKEHLPERIDPVDQTAFSKEWLEQVINSIRPRVDGIVITPVPIGTDPTDVVYVVEIPQSTTAHQAVDWRYYKRYNFLSIPMEDYEIRDVMGRQQHPKIELDFEIEVTTQQCTSGIVEREVTTQTEYELKVTARNPGQVYAQYVNAFIRIPYEIAYRDKFHPREPVEENGTLYCEYYLDNTVRDVVDVEFLLSPIEKYGPARFQPILPGLSRGWRTRLSDGFPQKKIDGLSIKWA
ncbi:unnamed protein product, partial [marine sediment metagenome]